MSRSPIDCHLIVPGLFEGITELTSKSGLGTFPALEKFLSRASRSAFSLDFPHLMADLLNIPTAHGDDVPTAAMMSIGRGAAPLTAGQYWVMATPVLLKPDRDRLVLHPAHVSLLPDELIRTFSDHFSAQFREILLTEQAQWLIHLNEKTDVVTQPLMKVIGRNVDQFLPQGKDRQYWHGLMNEIQMLFHNLQTSEYGFNSLWFEGVGQLPATAEVADQHKWKIYGASDLLEPFVKFTGCENPALAEILKDAQFESPIIIAQKEMMHAIEARSVDLWIEAMTKIEQLLADLLNKLKKKSIDNIRLYPLDGSIFELNRSSLRRFWLRPKPVSNYFDTNQ